jgi:uncharacterized protein YbaP (TraB family)
VSFFRVLFFSSLIFFQILFAQSSVWKISDDQNHTLYIGGTFHLLRAADFPLPLEFEEAYKQSDYVVFETDLSLTHSAAFQKMMAQKMMLPSNQSLSSKLTSKTYQTLKQYVESQGYSMRMFDRMQPWAVSLTVSQLKLSSIGVNQEGVDSYYLQRSMQDKLPQRFLESIEEQVNVLSEIGEEEEDAVILQTLKEMKGLPSMMSWMVNEWKEGKTVRLERELVNELKKDSPKMYRIVLKQRNNIWMPKLLSMLHEEKRGFVLVGAMHLLGEDGLLEQLQNLGYKIEWF